VPPLPRTCIIGAGSSGIAAVKTLHERDLPFDCFEKSDRVGGNWVFGNSNGLSAAYRSLHINTSRRVMEYSDFPMPDHYPDFPHHSQIAEYFDRYVDHFGVRDRITFETAVERARRRHDGVWEVELDTGEVRHYDAVLVANGHHWDARWPEPSFPGHFEGRQMHAHEYVDARGFEDQHVVVLGMGNSAMDIAVETSWVSARTHLAARRGAWIAPKYLFGRPADELLDAAPWVPMRIRGRVLELMLRLVVGRYERFGLAVPDHRLLQAHPTVSSDILSRIAHGEITPKPTLAELKGDRVRFADGSEERADVIVYCTGYKVTFPFFDPSFIAAPDNDLPLYRRVFKEDVPDVFFIGLLQPWGAIMPIAEAQSKLVAAYLRGEYALPGARTLRREIARERRAVRRRYVASHRHTMQVDGPAYLRGLLKEAAAGAERARRQGFRLPVAPRAATASDERLAA
jgi:dimethylaniline monooxygenase (N-oxide forming)